MVPVIRHPARIGARGKIGAGGSERPGWNVEGDSDSPEDDRIEADYPEHDANNIERPARPKKVPGIDVAAPVSDGVRRRGDREHEPYRCTYRGGHHQDDRVYAHADGRDRYDRHQDGGHGGVRGDLRGKHDPQRHDEDQEDYREPVDEGERLDNRRGKPALKEPVREGDATAEEEQDAPGDLHRPLPLHGKDALPAVDREDEEEERPEDRDGGVFDPREDHIQARDDDPVDLLCLLEYPAKGGQGEDDERPPFPCGDRAELSELLPNDPAGARESRPHPAVGDQGEPYPGNEEEYRGKRNAELHPGEEIDGGCVRKDRRELGDEDPVRGGPDDRGDPPDGRGVGDGDDQAPGEGLLPPVEALK